MFLLIESNESKHNILQGVVDIVSVIREKE
jgi:hypothetical protein